MVLVGFVADIYIWFWLVSQRRCMVLIGFDVEMYCVWLPSIMRSILFVDFGGRFMVLVDFDKEMLVLIGFDADVYGFGWFRCGDIWFWLVSLRICMVLVVSAVEMYGFGCFRCGDV